MKDAEPDVVFFSELPSGVYLLIVQATRRPGVQSNDAGPAPVFGAGRGTFSILREDDEHLKDFKEYMK